MPGLVLFTMVMSILLAPLNPWTIVSYVITII
jgi:hypothetical protein